MYNDGPEFGFIEVDWEKKDVDFQGMDGGGGISREEALTLYEESKASYKFILVYWADENQLCLYTPEEVEENCPKEEEGEEEDGEEV